MSGKYRKSDDLKNDGAKPLPRAAISPVDKARCQAATSAMRVLAHHFMPLASTPLSLLRSCAPMEKLPVVLPTVCGLSAFE